MIDPDALGCEILLEDGPLLVVNKPAGLPTESQPGGKDSLVQNVKSFLQQKYDKPGNVYLGIPHRLDTPVSGAIVFSRNSKGAARLSEQFANREVRKLYWAILQSRPPQPKGMLCDWMKKDSRAPRAIEAEEEDPDAKEARLIYEMVSSPDDEVQLCRIELLTGRMHQIRWQFGSRGYPILGDELYGARESFENRRILLHARQLVFKHPIRYDEIVITAPLPAYWPETNQT